MTELTSLLKKNCTNLATIKEKRKRKAQSKTIYIELCYLFHSFEQLAKNIQFQDTSCDQKHTINQVIECSPRLFNISQDIHGTLSFHLEKSTTLSLCVLFVRSLIVIIATIIVVVVVKVVFTYIYAHGSSSGSSCSLRHIPRNRFRSCKDAINKNAMANRGRMQQYQDVALIASSMDLQQPNKEFECLKCSDLKCLNCFKESRFIENADGNDC